MATVTNTTTPAPASLITHPAPCPPWCVNVCDDEPVHVSHWSPVAVNVDGNLAEKGSAQLLIRLERGFPGQRRTGVGFCLNDEYFDLTRWQAIRLAGLLAALICRSVGLGRRPDRSGS